MPRGDGLVHGTIGGYTNFRCRCQPCRDANLEYAREWRARNPERVRENQRRNYHTPSRIASHAAWREANKQRTRSATRLRIYGLSQNEWDAMVDAQGGVCAICRRSNPDRSLHVDHDHTTGKVRGLLCSGCNAAIGRLGDSVEGLTRALDYLKATSASSSG